MFLLIFGIFTILTLKLEFSINQNQKGPNAPQKSSIFLKAPWFFKFFFLSQSLNISVIVFLQRILWTPPYTIQI